MATTPSGITRRRAFQGAAAAVVVLGLLMWWLLPLGRTSPSGSVVLSTGASQGVYEQYGELLEGKLAASLPDLSVTLRNSQGSPDNLALLATKKADFTIATADAVAKYREDRLGGWQHLRGCARLYDDYVQLIVPRTSDIRSVADLRHKKVGVGERKSGVRLIADRVLRAADLGGATDVRRAYRSIGEMPTMLEEGTLDAFFWSGGLPTKAVTDLSDRLDIRLVPLTSELIGRLHESGEDASRHYRLAEIPADAYESIASGPPVTTIAVANLLVTTDRTDPELTEGFTRVVMESRDSIGVKVHPAQSLDLRTAIYTDPLPLHPGAKRYYRSVKP